MQHIPIKFRNAVWKLTRSLRRPVGKTDWIWRLCSGKQFYAIATLTAFVSWGGAAGAFAPKPVAPDEHSRTATEPAPVTAGKRVEMNSEANPPQTVTWDEIKVSAMGAMCLSEQCGVMFGGQICRNPRKGVVDELVDSVLRDIIFLFVSIPPLYRYDPNGVHAACDIPDKEARRRAAAEKVLADAEFMRAFVPRLATALKANKLVCANCPAVAGRALRELSWKDLSLYFTAFVSPRLRTGQDGQLKVGFKICSGSEAAAQIPNADIGLVRVGFFLAQRADAVREVTSDEMQKAMADAAFTQLGSDPDKNGYLKQRVSERLRTDATVRKSVCQLVADYQLALGLDVPECRIPTGQ